MKGCMLRNVVSIDDLTNEEIESLFRLADEFLEKMSVPGHPHRLTGRNDLAQGRILATIFAEPSTRTRLSFESAMLRLGGQVISSADANTSSAAKGESIADAVRVVENYADLIVIRHSFEGAARAAADYTSIPVINAGDGSHEHPTQTLCDLYTLRIARKTKSGEIQTDALRDLNVVLRGDLHDGRTAHSLAFALARFGSQILPDPAPGCDFPEHVRRRLARDYGCFPLISSDVDNLPQGAFPADVVYVTPEEPHQLALLPDVDNVWVRLSKRQQKSIRGMKHVDAFYATRLQLERIPPEHRDQMRKQYGSIDAKFLNEKKYRHSRVLHPLPRTDELSYELDRDERGVYFQQAAYGVPVRMALIAALLELQPGLLSPVEAPGKYAEYQHPQGIHCGNKRCVTRQKTEMHYLVPKFWIVDNQPLTTRCIYCDFEIEPKIVAQASTRRFTDATSTWREIDLNDMVIFDDETSAVSAGYQRNQVMLSQKP